MRKHPHLNPIFPTTLPTSKQHFQHPTHTLRQQSIPNKHTDQRLSSSSSDLVNKNKNKRGKNANVARMKNNINTIAAKNTFAIIYRLPQTMNQRTTMKTERTPVKGIFLICLLSQEQSIPRTFRFNLFEFNFFNLNIGIGFSEQLHPDRRIPINTPDFILAIVFNVAFVYDS